MFDRNARYSKVFYVLLTTFLIMAVMVAGMFTMQSLTEASTITVGLYDDNGTWDVGKTAIKNFLDSKGVSYILMSSFDVNSKKWNKFNEIDVFWVPGGYAGDYNFLIKDSGYQHIRDFVSNGGKMIGTCAGQYFMADRITWEGDFYDDGYYDLDLFQGEVNGSLHDIIPWAGYTNTTINLDSSHPVNANHPSSLEMVYYGGGDIWPDEVQTVSWIGSYDVTNTKGIASFPYGSGHALFMGPHPEVGLDANNNWVTDGSETAQWDWLSDAFDWLVAQ